MQGDNKNYFKFSRDLGNMEKSYVLFGKDGTPEIRLAQVEQAREVKDDEKNFIEIVEYLLYYYENKEEYEKCSTLSKVLDNWEKMKMKKK